MFTPTLGNLPLLLLFVISTATPFLPSHFSTRQDPDGPCTCYTDQSGLYCGSRSDGSDNASLAGPCEPSFLYRCDGNIGCPARVQVFGCGDCVYGPGLGDDVCSE